MIPPWCSISTSSLTCLHSGVGRSCSTCQCHRYGMAQPPPIRRAVSGAVSSEPPPPSTCIGVCRPAASPDPSAASILASPCFALSERLCGERMCGWGECRWGQNRLKATHRCVRPRTRPRTHARTHTLVYTRSRSKEDGKRVERTPKPFSSGSKVNSPTSPQT